MKYLSLILLISLLEVHNVDAGIMGGPGSTPISGGALTPLSPIGILPLPPLTENQKYYNDLLQEQIDKLLELSEKLDNGTIDPADAMEELMAICNEITQILEEAQKLGTITGENLIDINLAAIIQVLHDAIYKKVSNPEPYFAYPPPTGYL